MESELLKQIQMARNGETNETFELKLYMPIVGGKPEPNRESGENFLQGMIQGLQGDQQGEMIESIVQEVMGQKLEPGDKGGDFLKRFRRKRKRKRRDKVVEVVGTQEEAVVQVQVAAHEDQPEKLKEKEPNEENIFVCMKCEDKQEDQDEMEPVSEKEAQKSSSSQQNNQEIDQNEWQIERTNLQAQMRELEESLQTQKEQLKNQNEMWQEKESNWTEKLAEIEELRRNLEYWKEVGSSVSDNMIRPFGVPESVQLTTMEGAHHHPRAEEVIQEFNVYGAEKVGEEGALSSQEQNTLSQQGGQLGISTGTFQDVNVDDGDSRQMKNYESIAVLKESGMMEEGVWQKQEIKEEVEKESKDGLTKEELELEIEMEIDPEKWVVSEEQNMEKENEDENKKEQEEKDGEERDPSEETQVTHPEEPVASGDEQDETLGENPQPQETEQPKPQSPELVAELKRVKEERDRFKDEQLAEQREKLRMIHDLQTELEKKQQEVEELRKTKEQEEERINQPQPNEGVKGIDIMAERIKKEQLIDELSNLVVGKDQEIEELNRRVELFKDKLETWGKERLGGRARKRLVGIFKEIMEGEAKQVLGKREEMESKERPTQKDGPEDQNLSNEFGNSSDADTSFESTQRRRESRKSEGRMMKRSSRSRFDETSESLGRRKRNKKLFKSELKGEEDQDEGSIGQRKQSEWESNIVKEGQGLFEDIKALEEVDPKEENQDNEEADLEDNDQPCSADQPDYKNLTEDEIIQQVLDRTFNDESGDSKPPSKTSSNILGNLNKKKEANQNKQKLIINLDIDQDEKEKEKPQDDSKMYSRSVTASERELNSDNELAQFDREKVLNLLVAQCQNLENSKLLELAKKAQRRYKRRIRRIRDLKEEKKMYRKMYEEKVTEDMQELEDKYQMEQNMNVTPVLKYMFANPNLKGVRELSELLNMNVAHNLAKNITSKTNELDNESEGGTGPVDFRFNMNDSFAQSTGLNNSEGTPALNSGVGSAGSNRAMNPNFSFGMFTPILEEGQEGAENDPASSNLRREESRQILTNFSKMLGGDSEKSKQLRSSLANLLLSNVVNNQESVNSLKEKTLGLSEIRKKPEVEDEEDLMDFSEDSEEERQMQLIWERVEEMENIFNQSFQQGQTPRNEREESEGVEYNIHFDDSFRADEQGDASALSNEGELENILQPEDKHSDDDTGDEMHMQFKERRVTFKATGLNVHEVPENPLQNMESDHPREYLETNDLENEQEMSDVELVTERIQKLPTEPAETTDMAEPKLLSVSTNLSRKIKKTLREKLKKQQMLDSHDLKRIQETGVMSRRIRGPKPKLNVNIYNSEGNKNQQILELERSGGFGKIERLHRGFEDLKIRMKKILDKKNKSKRKDSDRELKKKWELERKRREIESKRKKELEIIVETLRKQLANSRKQISVIGKTQAIHEEVMEGEPEDEDSGGQAAEEPLIETYQAYDDEVSGSEDQEKDHNDPAEQNELSEPQMDIKLDSKIKESIEMEIERRGTAFARQLVQTKIDHIEQEDQDWIQMGETESQANEAQTENQSGRIDIDEVQIEAQKDPESDQEIDIEVTQNPSLGSGHQVPDDESDLMDSNIMKSDIIQVNVTQTIVTQDNTQNEETCQIHQSIEVQDNITGEENEHPKSQFQNFETDKNLDQPEKTLFDVSNVAVDDSKTVEHDLEGAEEVKFNINSEMLRTKISANTRMENEQEEPNQYLLPEGDQPNPELKAESVKEVTHTKPRKSAWDFEPPILNPKFLKKTNLKKKKKRKRNKSKRKNKKKTRESKSKNEQEPVQTMRERKISKSERDLKDPNNILGEVIATHQESGFKIHIHKQTTETFGEGQRLTESEVVFTQTPQDNRKLETTGKREMTLTQSVPSKLLTRVLDPLEQLINQKFNVHSSTSNDFSSANSSHSSQMSKQNQLFAASMQVNMSEIPYGQAKREGNMGQQEMSEYGDHQTERSESIAASMPDYGLSQTADLSQLGSNRSFLVEGGQKKKKKNKKKKKKKKKKAHMNIDSDLLKFGYQASQIVRTKVKKFEEDP